MRGLIVAVVASALTTPSSAGSPQTNRVHVTSARQACRLVIRAAVVRRLSTRNLDGRLTCEPPKLYRLGYWHVRLHYIPEPDEFVGSSLVGDFAVRARDGVLLNWDITDSKPRPLQAPAQWDEQSARKPPPAPDPEPRNFWIRP